MKTLKKKRRIQVLIVTAVSLVVAVVLINIGFKDSINFFRAPTQVFEEPPEEGEVFRLGGLVKEGSLKKLAGVELEFIVTDGNKDVFVHYVGVELRPDLFEEGRGTIVTGKMEGDTFVATKILAKHDENYEPKEVTDALKEQGVYVDPNQ